MCKHLLGPQGLMHAALATGLCERTILCTWQEPNKNSGKEMRQPDEQKNRPAFWMPIQIILMTVLSTTQLETFSENTGCKWKQNSLWCVCDVFYRNEFLGWGMQKQL